MLALHCDPRCDGDVVVSSLDVSPFSSSPLLMSSCTARDDVAAAALLPCENRCEKKSPQRYARGMQVVEVTSFFRGTFSLRYPLMIVIMMSLLYFFAGH